MCIFCKIVNGEIPNNTVHESEHFMAFHDLYPKAPIHILIIPKQHVDCFQNVTPEMMGGLTTFAQEVATTHHKQRRRRRTRDHALTLPHARRRKTSLEPPTRRPT
jgi:diadenosine tetraphosphate (Ap4A) HIT family hydrolase